MSQISKDILDSITQSTILILKQQCQLEAVSEKPFKKESSLNTQVQIASVLDLKGKMFQGKLAIAFPTGVYLSIVEKMIGESFSEISSEISDGAAELLNIIFGAAKVILNESGYAFEKALPKVLLKSSDLDEITRDRSTWIIPFRISTGEFFIEISHNQ